MKDDRKSMKVTAAAKEQLRAVKAAKGFKNESEALLYLIEVYRLRGDTLTLREHYAAVNRVEDQMRQSTIDL